MRYRMAIVAVLALAVLGGSMGCSAKTSITSSAGNASSQPQSSVSASRAVAIQSLTLAGVSNPRAELDFGKTLAPSVYRTFLVGHVASALPESKATGPVKLAGILVTFDDQGTAALGAWSSTHVGKRMLILFDGKLLFSPSIAEPLRGGRLFVGVDASSALGAKVIRAAVDSRSGKP